MRGPERFDPRRAALTYAAEAERVARVKEDGWVVAELANTVACGLVYVGDQIARQNALLPVLLNAISAGEAEEIARSLNEALGSVPNG